MFLTQCVKLVFFGTSDNLVKESDNMLNYIWFGMMVLSVFCSILTGRTEQLSKAAVGGADKSIQLLISMAGSMCLWTGIMKIADKGGITQKAAKLLSPILGMLMPEYKENKAAMGAVSANITANILGLGNAATPLGIAAMKEMQKNNTLRTSPNNGMVMFVVINTASVQLIPTTIAAMRQAAGSADPYYILPYIWIASVLSLVSGLIVAKVLSVWS